MLGNALALTVVVVPAVGAAPRTPSWPNDARGAVSLTYDDGLDSQLEFGVPQLQAAGFKATFFLTQENMEARLSDWQHVASLGHEIADHTETHPCALARYNAAGFERTQIAPMEAFLDANFGATRPRFYAYPCGLIGLGRGPASVRFGRYSRLLSQDFAAARTVAGLPNDPRHAWNRRMHLSAFEPTYDADDPTLAFTYLRRAMRDGHWAILVFHDILPKRTSEGETSAAVHKRILDFINGQALWCAPMGEVFEHLTQHA